MSESVCESVSWPDTPNKYGVVVEDDKDGDADPVFFYEIYRREEPKDVLEATYGDYTDYDEACRDAENTLRWEATCPTPSTSSTSGKAPRPS